MQKIEPPEFLALSVFEDCIPIKKNADVKSRLKVITQLITDAENAYKEKAKSSSFHETGTESGIANVVTTAEMEDLYVSVFARKSSPVRKKYYDVLMLAPDNGTCPMCGQRDVSTLDHYLPKAKNPRLAVTPVNLIPACKECNYVKGEYHPETKEKQFIHPYYDKLPDKIWLTANLEETRPPALKFYISPPNDFDLILANRLRWHFEKLKLASLYASQAGRTFSGIANKLQSAWDRGGKDEVRFVLNEDATSWSKSDQNSWQAVMFRTLANSDWFCEEGFAYAGEKRRYEV